MSVRKNGYLPLVKINKQIRYMLLPKKEFNRLVVLVGDKNYYQLFSWFVKILRKTRLPYLKYNGFWMSVMQINMIKALFKFQSELKKLKIEAVNTEAEKKIKENKLLIYREWIRILQTIADGIAWRNLKFNRPVIRLCSENKSPGYLSEEDLVGFLKYLSMMTGFVIANDLTRCLRISDLTQILPNGKTFLYEIKKSGDKLYDVNYILGHMRKQKKLDDPQKIRQLVVQLAIADNNITVPVYKNGVIREELKAEILDLDFPIQTHLSTIKKIIRKADKKGYAQTELEPGYFVEMSAYDKIAKREIDSDKYIQYKEIQFEKYAPEWLKNKKSKTVSISNYESFFQEGGHYPRNFLPYSVFPFSAKNCVRLMMGCLHLRIYLNLDIFEKKIKKAGWIVKKEERNLRFFKEQEKLHKKEYQEKGGMYKYKVDETFYRVSRSDKNGTYETSILTTQILIMLTSFYKTDFLIEEINHLYLEAKRTKSKKRIITINCLGEKRVLI